MTTDERVEAVARAMCFEEGNQGCGCEGSCKGGNFTDDDIFMRFAKAAIDALSSIPAQQEIEAAFREGFKSGAFAGGGNESIYAEDDAWTRYTTTRSDAPRAAQQEEVTEARKRVKKLADQIELGTVATGQNRLRITKDLRVLLRTSAARTPEPEVANARLVPFLTSVAQLLDEVKMDRSSGPSQLPWNEYHDGLRSELTRILRDAMRSAALRGDSGPTLAENLWDAAVHAPNERGER